MPLEDARFTGRNRPSAPESFQQSYPFNDRIDGRRVRQVYGQVTVSICVAPAADRLSRTRATSPATV